MFISGYPVTWSELNFQLDDFIPLLISSVALSDRQQVAQTATIIVRWRRIHNGRFTRRVGSYDRSFERGIRIRVRHHKLKSGARH
jgi:hypothetical protein